MLVGYDGKLRVAADYPVLHDNRKLQDVNDLAIVSETTTLLVARYARRIQYRGTTNPMEFAFAQNLFELYTAYWAGTLGPVYGCVTDLNSWLFLKFDGEAFYRADQVLKLALTKESILGLASVFYGLLN